MLRSMIIGLAIAALLQFGGHGFTLGSGISLPDQRIDWVKVQADALAHLLCTGIPQLNR